MYAVIRAIIAYINAAIKKLTPYTVNVTIKKIANTIADTKYGLQRIFCRAIANMIVAIGNINKNKTIFILSPCIFYVNCSFFDTKCNIILLLLMFFCECNKDVETFNQIIELQHPHIPH